MKNKILIVIITAGLLISGYLLFRPEQLSSVIEDSFGEQLKESQQNEESQTKKLDLSNQNIQKIPEYVFNQTDLEELNVSNNQLTGAIQAEIRHLQNLKILDISNNKLTGVSAEIGQLYNLQILNLSNNQLTGLPYELGNLKNLKILDISGNNYSEFDLNIIQEKLPADVNIIK